MKIDILKMYDRNNKVAAEALIYIPDNDDNLTKEEKEKIEQKLVDYAVNVRHGEKIIAMVSSNIDPNEAGITYIGELNDLNNGIIEIL